MPKVSGIIYLNLHTQLQQWLDLLIMDTGKKVLVSIIQEYIS